MKETVNEINTEAVCKNVFKDGSAVTTKKVFTAKWIELINLLERDKQYHIA